MRDSEKQKTYDAEGALYGTTLAGTLYHTRDEAQRFVNRVWPIGADPIKVVFDGRRKCFASATIRNGRRQIRCPKPLAPGANMNAFRELYFLHELAHHFVTWAPVPSLNGEGGGWTRRHTPGVSGHGPEFRSEFLRLVYEHRGPEAWQALRSQFDSRGLAYASPIPAVTEPREVGSPAADGIHVHGMA